LQNIESLSGDIKRILWKDAITFGLVAIPVALYPRNQARGIEVPPSEELGPDRVNYKRVAEASGKEAFLD